MNYPRFSIYRDGFIIRVWGDVVLGLSLTQWWPGYSTVQGYWAWTFGPLWLTNA